MVFFSVGDGSGSGAAAPSAVSLKQRQVPLARSEDHSEPGCGSSGPVRPISPDSSWFAGREGRTNFRVDEYERAEGDCFAEPRRTFSVCSSAADESIWSAHLAGGVRVPLSFYHTVGDQLRSIQALCDKQKAQTLRVPVEGTEATDI